MRGITGAMVEEERWEVVGTKEEATELELTEGGTTAEGLPSHTIIISRGRGLRRRHSHRHNSLHLRQPYHLLGKVFHKTDSQYPGDIYPVKTLFKILV